LSFGYWLFLKFICPCALTIFSGQPGGFYFCAVPLFREQHLLPDQDHDFPGQRNLYACHDWLQQVGPNVCRCFSFSYQKFRGEIARMLP
jgi:hypothetical protein